MRSTAKPLFLTLAALATACHAQIDNAVQTVGPINPSAVSLIKSEIKSMKDHGKHPDLLMISYSPGGDVRSLLQLVELANGNVNRVFVSGECLSACAEFLYLVDKPIIAAKNAKIGFHGDALTASRLVHPLGLTGPFVCLDQEAAGFARLLKSRGGDARTGSDAMLQRLRFYRAVELHRILTMVAGMRPFLPNIGCGFQPPRKCNRSC